MDINISSRNPLKMLGKTFMHIVTVPKGFVNAMGMYNAVCDKYGGMGQVECLLEWKCMAHEVQIAALLAAEGHTDRSRFIEERGVKKLDKVQVCTFRYIRRKDECFAPLLKTEITKAGIPFFTQQKMF